MKTQLEAEIKPKKQGPIKFTMVKPSVVLEVLKHLLSCYLG